ncbi:hypothetical protein HS088_TW20G00140 [Tripterygium wilfordii]|uniref:Uncharacterized protein n=1 Tax=Tripterygium wilfordii TaxID=458696 RepID=A0A7J7C7N7_TRIWF|nr:hypothetical protein HS088_TW20G00140 [Tripterygium wilfordii]
MDGGGELGTRVRNMRISNNGKSSADGTASGSDMCFVFGCRFRFRSAFDSYCAACEAFSEQQLTSDSMELKVELL